MDREDFKKAKWSEGTIVRISNPVMYSGDEVSPVLDIDFRDATLGIYHYGVYMRIPCEDIEIVEE